MRTFLVLIAAVSFVSGLMWHRYQLPPVGMGLVDGTIPAPPKFEVYKGSPDFPADDKGYRLWLDIFDLYHPKSYDVVMFGDSLTAGCHWNELLGLSEIANRAIGGSTTAVMVNRLDQIYRLQPKAVFIMAGINDLRYGRAIDETVQNMSHIVQALKSKGITTIVQSVLKTNQVKLNALVDRLNDEYKRVAEDEDVEFIDLNGTFASEGYLKSKYSHDGLHLSANGYGAWARLIEPKIRQFLPHVE